ncbi:MAG: hypothetical protein FJ149_00745 [Euryarchaeota archaeon]|nr:hypothetical protein [Euryarchaeota archaeon]
MQRALLMVLLSCLVAQAAAVPLTLPDRPGAPPDSAGEATYSWPAWSRDADGDRLDDELEHWMAGPGDGPLPVVVCYDRHPGPAQERALERLGGRVDYTCRYVPCIVATLPEPSIGAALSLPGVARLEAAVPLAPALDTSVPSVGIDRVRETSGLRGTGVTICVIDSGIDANHTALDDLDDVNTTKDPKVIAFYDATDSTGVTDGSTRPFDLDGHGTHVAAIAAGTGHGTPDFRYIGAAPGARLVGVKILENGSALISTDDALRGIEWAITNKDRFGTRVLSMSFGAVFAAPGISNDGTSAMSQLCNRAVADGLVCVVAAGNNGPLRRSIAPPADAIDVITVGNVEDDHTLNPTSSRGPVGRLTSSYTKPDVCAPGTDVYSAEAGSGDRFATKTGTSMACPHVSGLAALMIEASSGLRPQDLKDIFHSTAEPGKSVPWQSSPNNDYGWGTVNAPRALENCTNGTLPPVVHINPLERANGTALITGTASSARGTVVSVDVRIDAGEYRTAAGTTVWSYSWDTTASQNGAHTVTARAFDGTIYSYEYRLVVTVDNLYVTISTPPAIPVSGEYTFSGRADGLEVQSVEVRIDSGPWTEARDSSGSGFRTWDFTLNTTRLANGRHRLEARAFDGSRYSQLSDVEFEVNNRSEPRPAGGSVPGFEVAVVLLSALALLAVRGRRGRQAGPGE